MPNCKIPVAANAIEYFPNSTVVTILLKTNLSEDEVGELCQLVERVTTQHYVRQLLNRELL